MRPRRQVSIFFLVLISFQIGGYYGVMEVVKNRMTERTAHKIATERAPIGGQLVITIPAANYKRTSNGSFTFEGKVYQVIETHIYEDVLYITSIHNSGATDAQDTIDDFVQSLAGKNGEQGKAVKFFENLSKYFCSKTYSPVAISNGWTSEIKFPSTEDLYGFSQSLKLFHPPSTL